MMSTHTPAGRPAFVVNVEVFLERDGRWLFIERGTQEAHAPGVLAGIGGKVETDGAGVDVLEQTARREVAEEVGVDLAGTPLAYVESTYFVTDDGDSVINIVFSGTMPARATPVAAAPQEVAALAWLTIAEAAAHPACPPWIQRTLHRLAPG